MGQGIGRGKRGPQGGQRTVGDLAKQDEGLKNFFSALVHKRTTPKKVLDTQGGETMLAERAAILSNGEGETAEEQRL